MKSVPVGRRVSAVVALLAPLAVLAVVVVALLSRPLVLLAAAACLSLGVGAAAYAVTRPGIRRTLAAVVAVLGLGASVALLIGATGGPLASCWSWGCWWSAGWRPGTPWGGTSSR